MAAPRKRLLFLLHSLSVGGAERLVVQMAEQLEHEYEIGILCLDSQGQLWQQCEERGYQLFEIDRPPKWSFRTFSKVAEAIARFRPDIIHAHQYTPYLYGTIGKIIARSKARFIFTEHGRHYPDHVSAKRRFANRLLIRFTDVVTAVSKFSKDALYENEGLRSLPIQVIYNGLYRAGSEQSVDTDLRAELGLPDHSKVIGCVGSLRQVKNPVFLLRAFAQIAQQNPDTVLVYIGDGPLLVELQEERDRLGLNERVFTLGVRAPATPYFSQFSVYVLPSLCEAASLALLEAMSYGIPVVVTNRGGSPEIVEDQKSGVVVPSGDEDALAKALQALLDDEDKASRMAGEAQQRVEQTFSFDQMMSQYRLIYEQSH